MSKPVSSQYEAEKADEAMARVRAKLIAAVQWGLRLGSLAGILLPFMLLAVLTLDIRVRMFDGWAVEEGFRPSLWVSRGDLFFAASLLPILLITRRVGVTDAMRALALAWGVVIFFSLVMVIYLAPQLAEGDLPSARFVFGTVIAWGAAGASAAWLYDLVRGFEWWRGPLVALLGAAVVQSVLYQTIVFAGTGAPTLSWTIANIVVLSGLSAPTLLLFWVLKRRVRPGPGLGGH